jgi:hypothetical protein
MVSISAMEVFLSSLPNTYFYALVANSHVLSSYEHQINKKVAEKNFL